MTNITYGITEEIYEFENLIRVSYGVVAYADFEHNGTTTIITSIHDVSDNKKKLKELIQLCNIEKLSLIQFQEVIEDFLLD